MLVDILPGTWYGIFVRTIRTVGFLIRQIWHAGNGALPGKKHPILMVRFIKLSRKQTPCRSIYRIAAASSAPPQQQEPEQKR